MIPLDPPAGAIPLARHTAAPQPPAALTGEQARLRKAAEGFEALLLRRMLASARASFAAEDTPLTGGGMQQFRQLHDEHLADIAAHSGAFGFARSIEARLARHLRPAEDS